MKIKRQVIDETAAVKALAALAQAQRLRAFRALVAAGPQGLTPGTMAEQLGAVSEISSSSVTVKSSDGFTRSYALGADVVVSNLQQRRQQAGGTGTQLSVADIVAGGTVRIVAAKEGSGYTASSVMVVAATATGQSN